MTTTEDTDLPIFAAWLTFLDWLLGTTEKFPKSVRFTLAVRIENLALDFVEDLVDARYANRKIDVLRRGNLRLEKMRVLLRIAHKRRVLPSKSYHYAVREIDGIGRMLGGWIRQQASK